MNSTTSRQASVQGQRPTPHEELLLELRAIRRNQDTFLRLFDDFVGTFLNARFPYGKPTDRWPRR